MNSLLEKEGMRGKVQTIYIDPPYGIKFGSNWQVSTRNHDVKDNKLEDFIRQPEQVKAFRDTWELGIHSYLSYLRDRLVTAHKLLSESGSCFVQISDENVHLVRAIMDEVFRSENFVSQITVVKTSGLGSVLIPRQTDYLLWYSKNIDQVKYRQIYKEKGFDTSGAGAYNYIQLRDGSTRTLTRAEKENLALLPPGAKVFRYGDLTKPGPGRKYEVDWQGKKFTSGSRWWGMPEVSMYKLIQLGRIAIQGKSLAWIRYLDDFPFYPITNVWGDTGTGSGLDKIYVVQTDTKIVQRCILMSTDPGDIVLAKSTILPPLTATNMRYISYTN